MYTAFAVMLKHCSKTGEAERAMFYLDEMVCFDLKPNLDIFMSLFRACAEAPHWVNGYEDFIFDAMCKMEGAEIAPTVEIYNSIIYAFSRACDARAAEFYFLEMKGKGLEPDCTSYNSLLNAYSRAQVQWMSLLVFLSHVYIISYHTN